jgi:hypothetical protein
MNQGCICGCGMCLSMHLTPGTAWHDPGCDVVESFDVGLTGSTAVTDSNDPENNHMQMHHYDGCGFSSYVFRLHQLGLAAWHLIV